VSAQLFQLLAQLDRPGATELVIATGRQVAVRINNAYQTLTASAVTLPQLVHLIRETQLAALVPSSEQVGDPVAIDLDGRALRAQFLRRGEDVMLRIEHRPAAPPPARPTPMPAQAAQAPVPPPATEPAPTPPAPSQGALFVPASAAPAAMPTGLIDEPSQIVPALAALVMEARLRRATDLHVAANRPVLVRVVGDLVALGPAPRSASEVEGLLLPLLGPVRRRQLADRGYVDLSIDVPGAGRLRTNVSRQQGGYKGAFRLAV